MKRAGAAVKRAALAIVLLVAALGTRPARGWSSHEHAAQARQGFSIACAHLGCPAVWPAYGVDTDGLRKLYSDAAQTPDYCHSFWHSRVASDNFQCEPRHVIGSDVRTCARGDCQVFAGQSMGPNPAWLVPLVMSAQAQYVLRTNENHFGDSAKDHWQFYSDLAAFAAQRARDTCNPVCVKLAVGLQGFAYYYIEDRTASGHAWNDETYLFRYGTSRPDHHRDNVRGCIHGSQGPTGRLGLSCSNILGLGDDGQRFGDDFWGTSDRWQNDEGWNRAPGVQSQETQAGDSAAIGAVLSTLSCQSAAATWTPAFVSNLDFCRVVVKQCCQWTGWFGDEYACDVCDGGDDRLTADAIYAACPISVGVGPNTINLYVTHIQRGFDWGETEVTLLVPPGGYEGTEAARTLLAGSGSVHPDAFWDGENAILDRAGCTADVKMCGAPVKPSACATWPCDLDKVTYCRGNLPADACGRCDRYYKHTFYEADPGGAGWCGCPAVVGDGMCAIDAGEDITNSTDCGPRYCGDGTCDDVHGESPTTCPTDCPGTARTTSCAFSTVEACDARGPIKDAVPAVCGNDVLDPGETCSTCPQDAAVVGVQFGRPYPGVEACTAADPAYAQKHFTSQSCAQECCVPASCGGWCAGFCDAAEGCVPTGTPDACPGSQGPSCNTQRAACGWGPIAGGDVLPPPTPPLPTPSTATCGDTCTPALTARQKLRCGFDVCEDFDCTDTCCETPTGTRRRDCTAGACDISSGDNGTCVQANLCCDDCDPCNGTEYWAASTQTCETASSAGPQMCSPDAGVPADAGGAIDGGVPVDAGNVDAAVIDAALADAALIDSALIDAALIDAVVADSALADSALADSALDNDGSAAGNDGSPLVTDGSPPGDSIGSAARPTVSSDSEGCAAGGAGASGSIALLILATLVAMRRRRRRR